MPQYAYHAQNSAGQIVVGVLQSNSPREAVHKLNEQQLLPLHLSQPATHAARSIKLSYVRQSRLYQMLADLVDSGMPLLKSIEVVGAQSSHAPTTALLAEIASKVADGTPLHQALATFPGTFDEMTRQMIRAGEEGGFVEQSLQRVAILQQRRAAMRSELLGALAYPAFLLIVGILVVSGMLVFFVPKFEPLFARLQASGQLPWSTSALLGTSNLLRHHGIVLIAIILGIGMLAAVWLRSPSFKLKWDGWKLKLRWLGPVLVSSTMAVYCRVLGTLLSNGVPLLDALRIAQGTTNNLALQYDVQQATQAVVAGGNFADSLHKSGLIPKEIVEVIRIGERSNRLDKVLIKLADQLDQRTQIYMGLLARLVEPSLMVVMAVVIGFLMIALLMPIFMSSGRFA